MKRPSYNKPLEQAQKTQLALLKKSAIADANKLQLLVKKLSDNLANLKKRVLSGDKSVNAASLQKAVNDLLAAQNSLNAIKVKRRGLKRQKKNFKLGSMSKPMAVGLGYYSSLGQSVADTASKIQLADNVLLTFASLSPEQKNAALEQVQKSLESIDGILLMKKKSDLGPLTSKYEDLTMVQKLGIAVILNQDVDFEVVTDARKDGGDVPAAEADLKDAINSAKLDLKDVYGIDPSLINEILVGKVKSKFPLYIAGGIAVILGSALLLMRK